MIIFFTKNTVLRFIRLKFVTHIYLIMGQQNTKKKLSRENKNIGGLPVIHDKQAMTVKSLNHEVLIRLTMKSKLNYGEITSMALHPTSSSISNRGSKAETINKSVTIKQTLQKYRQDLQPVQKQCYARVNRYKVK